MTTQPYLTLSDISLAGKPVFVHADFNVLMNDGHITDDARIRATLPGMPPLPGGGRSGVHHLTPGVPHRRPGTRTGFAGTSRKHLSTPLGQPERLRTE